MEDNADYVAVSKMEKTTASLTRHEWLKSLTLEELAEELAGDITDFLFELIWQPDPAEVCKAWLMEDMDE